MSVLWIDGDRVEGKNAEWKERQESNRNIKERRYEAKGKDEKQTGDIHSEHESRYKQYSKSNMNMQ
jgi:hypothetical protein